MLWFDYGLSLPKLMLEFNSHGALTRGWKLEFSYDVQRLGLWEVVKIIKGLQGGTPKTENSWLYKKRGRGQNRYTHAPVSCLPCDGVHHLGTLPVRRLSPDAGPQPRIRIVSQNKPLFC